MKALTKTFTAKIEQFNAALNGAKLNLIAAGKLLCEMLDENEDAFDILIGQCRVTLPFLEALERVGRGKLDPLFLTDPSPAAQRAVAFGLNQKEQAQLKTGVPVAFRDNGGIKVEKRSFSEITSAQEAARVISPEGHIRSTDEQIQLIREQEARAAIRKLTYEVFPDRVRFHEGAEFNYSQLIAIADKIAPQPTDIQAEMQRRQIKHEPVTSSPNHSQDKRVDS